MFKALILAAGLAALPAAAFAQTTVTTQQQGAQAPAGAAAGAAAGAVGGAIVGGPVGAAVGAVGGAIVGGVAGGMQPEFRTYVVEQRHPAYRWDGKVVIGETLPPNGVTYYAVPEKFGKTEYRYTVVNDRTVLVDPKTRKIVQIIE
ncbi:MAG: DUF1236 domain-containing protein [Methylobacteriaceae bacterium]|nr:DUF1236 domain-containing protein [Methylobacteriaceae bacterium]